LNGSRGFFDASSWSHDWRRVDVPWPWLWILLPLLVDPYCLGGLVLLLGRK